MNLDGCFTMFNKPFMSTDVLDHGGHAPEVRLTQFTEVVEKSEDVDEGFSRLKMISSVNQRVWPS